MSILCNLSIFCRPLLPFRSTERRFCYFNIKNDEYYRLDLLFMHINGSYTPFWVIEWKKNLFLCEHNAHIINTTTTKQPTIIYLINLINEYYCFVDCMLLWFTNYIFYWVHTNAMQINVFDEIFCYFCLVCGMSRSCQRYLPFFFVYCWKLILICHKKVFKSL